MMVDEAGLTGLPVSQLVSRAGVPWHEREAFVTRITRARPGRRDRRHPARGISHLGSRGSSDRRL